MRLVYHIAVPMSRLKWKLATPEAHLPDSPPHLLMIGNNVLKQLSSVRGLTCPVCQAEDEVAWFVQPDKIWYNIHFKAKRGKK